MPSVQSKSRIFWIIADEHMYLLSSLYFFPILFKELQTDLNTHGTKIDGAQFFIQLQKEDND